MAEGTEGIPCDEVTSKFNYTDFLPISGFSPKKSPSEIYGQFAADQYKTVRDRFQAKKEQDFDDERFERRRRAGKLRYAGMTYTDAEDPSLFVKQDVTESAKERAAARAAAYYPGRARDEITMRKHSHHYRALEGYHNAGDVEAYDDNLNHLIENAYAFRRNVRPASGTYHEHKLISDLSHEQGYRAIAPHMFVTQQGSRVDSYLSASLRTPSFWEHRLTQTKRL